jgi:endonuclease G
MKKLLPFLILLFAFSVQAQTSAVSLALGNPSGATVNESNPDNYLVTHTSYILSYNKSRGAANWVMWHLEKSDIGDTERTNDFAPDTTLPRQWWITPTDYSGSGYDRGHMCPSKDRSDSIERNRETFLMSNMQPQTPKLNQKTWKYLEDYTREIVSKGKDGEMEAYIFAGCYGDQGKLKEKITIPTSCFKIIVVLPKGDNDLKRIDKKTRVIAVNMPNDKSVSERWRTYLTTIDDIEEKTGYDFLSEVSKKTQKAIESKIDDQSSDTKTESKSDAKTDNKSESKTTEISEDKKTTETKDSKSTDKTSKSADKSNKSDRTYMLGSRGGCYYLTESGNKTYVDKKYCENLPGASTDKKDDKSEQKSEDKTEDSDKSDDKKSDSNSSKPSADGRTYIKGSRGGCYYLTESGRKVYVKDKSLCEQ